MSQSGSGERERKGRRKGERARERNKRGGSWRRRGSPLCIQTSNRALYKMKRIRNDMRTADPALNPSAAARRWFPRRPGSPSQPQPRAGEAGGQDGAERAAPSPFPAQASAGRRVLPGVSVMQRGRSGKPCRAAGAGSRGTPPRTHNRTCAHAPRSQGGGDTHTRRQGRAGSHAAAPAPSPWGVTYLLMPAAPQHTWPRQPRAAMPRARTTAGSAGSLPAFPWYRLRPPQAPRCVSPTQGPPAPMPARQPPLATGSHPGGMQRGPAHRHHLPCAPQATGTPCPKRLTGLAKLKEGFWHFELGYP